MSQVFLSYRHVPRDEALAQGLCAYLQARGLRVFLDKQIRVGLDWVAVAAEERGAHWSGWVGLGNFRTGPSNVKREGDGRHAAVPGSDVS